MIVKFVIPLGVEREVRPGMLVSGVIAVVRAESIDQAREILRRECESIGAAPWDHVADVKIVPEELHGVIAIAM